MISKPVLAARQLLNDCGIENTAEIDIKDLIVLKDGIVKEIPLGNCDGRMVMKKGKSIVSLNSNIEFPKKKRFVLAHELGHIILHGGNEATFSDDYETLETYKKGPQEVEANQFASELLMPEAAFTEACFKKKFSPDLIIELSEKFNTSLTSSVYRYLELGNHPICCFYSKNGKMVYWKKSEHFYYRVPDRNKLAVPTDSVANEYYVYKRIYSKKDAAQEITKSTWFELGENDRDSSMFEFCIITPAYNTVLSIVWEK